MRTGFVVALLLSGAPAARANDAAFRGAPADLFPQKQANERMESEDILLVATPSEWRVTAKYVFKTTSQEKVRLQIGFPELRCLSDEDGPCRDSRAFRDLQTLVDGKPVTLKRGKLAKRAEWSEYLGTIWLFDVEFPPQGRVTIEHRYRVQTGEDSMGDRFTDYVIRTGGAWGGPIERARFVVRFPAFAFEVAASVDAGFKLTPPRLVDGREPHVELVAEATELRPAKDLHFAFNARADRADGADGTLTFDQVVRDGSAEAVRERLNLLHAAKGFPFRSRELWARFYSDQAAFEPMQGEKHRWKRKLRALPAFTRDWFLREDREELVWLEKRRDELKLAVDSSAAGAAVASGADALAPALAPAIVPSGAPDPVPRASEPSAIASGPAPAAARREDSAKARGACGCTVPGAERRDARHALAFGLAACLAALRRRRRRVPETRA